MAFKTKAARLKDDYVATFGPKCGPAAERVLRDLVEECGLMQRSFVPGDSHGTAFNDGARSPIIHIFEMAFGDKGSMEKIQEIETDFAKEDAA